MATPDMDVIKNIPGYKVILKTVLKSQIQHLVQQLSSTTDEESMILTASLSDGSLSHLGSDFGKGFIEDHKDLKSQFLSFCLKKQYGIKQQENKSQETDTVEASIQDSHVYMSKRSPKSGHLRTSSSRTKKSMGIRFEPYPMTRSRMSAINLNPASEPRHSHVIKELDKQMNKFKSKVNSEVPNLSERDKPFTATNELINDANDNDNVDDYSVQQNNIDNENDEAYPLLGVKLEAVAKTIETFAEIDNEFEHNDVEPMGTAIETETEITGDEHMGTEYKTEPGIGVESPIVMLTTPTDSNVLLNMKPDSFDDTDSQSDMNEKENDGAPLPHCDNSKQSFLSNIAVQTQASVHIDIKPVICNKCGKAFDERNLSTIPSGNHTIVKPYQCETCSSTSTLQFKRTSVEKHETNGYKCEDCGKYFTQKCSLQRHLVVHTGIKPFTCDTCGTSFASKSHLSSHLATHLGLKPFKCDKCGKSFTQKSSLLSHLALHSGLKPFKCDECGKSFTQKSNLTSHFASHSRIKPFKCDICGKSFKYKRYIISHLASHSGIKPFKCDKCGKSFTQKSNLNSHLARHSGG